jgi:hypothetical protein
MKSKEHELGNISYSDKTQIVCSKQTIEGTITTPLKEKLETLLQDPDRNLDKLIQLLIENENIKIKKEFYKHNYE